MAVSFKVPKSPKRDVFAIDTFLGVDLTNVGANIDEVRSPNAENMVRQVPGKVRKRMGYHTKYHTGYDRPVYGRHVIRDGIEEGNRVVNVNRALGTSSAETYYQFNVESVYICDLAEDIDEYVDLYLELDFRQTDLGGNIGFYVWNEPLPSNQLEEGANLLILNESSHTEGNHYHGSVSSFNIHNPKLYMVGLAPFGPRGGYLSKVSVMYDVDENYTWSPAPEDDYGYFHIEDVYLDKTNTGMSNRNYSKSGTAHDSQYDTSIEITSLSTLVHFTFDITTKTRYELSWVRVYITNNNDEVLWEKTYTENLIDEHIDEYISTENFWNGSAWFQYPFKRLNFEYQLAGISDSGYVKTYVKNLNMHEVECRADFNLQPEWNVYHVGNYFLAGPKNAESLRIIRNDANEHKSMSWQFNRTLYIIDGESLYSYVKEAASAHVIDEEDAYVPTITIAKAPSGGGVAYEPLNMLQPAFIEMFQGDGTSVKYQLSFSGLDATLVDVWELNNQGNWIHSNEDIDFTVDRATGEITFETAPGVSPITGEDNVKIKAYRTVEGYRERVFNCTIGTLFGVGGAEDRLFLSGNPDYPNWDFYSEQNDPTYFPDTGYSALGSEQSAIIGYAKINNYLATIKDGYDASQTVFIREGDLVVNDDVSEPAFKIINTLQGNGAISPYAFSYLINEPLFLTKAGVYAITAQDITGEKYGQNRSFYLNGKLTKESNLKNAVSVTYNDMYVLAVNDQLYILDGLQPTRTDKSEPYATRQYVGFYCTNIPAVTLWTEDDKLCFGTEHGDICEFYTDPNALASYNDNGSAIYCCWETPDLDGHLFYKNKTFRYFAIRMLAALKTSVKMYSQKLGAWSFIKEDTTTGLIFDFEFIDFARFTFSTDKSQKVAHTKVRVKKVDKARFRVENGKVNEPFGLVDLALEYIESGNYKG